MKQFVVTYSGKGVMTMTIEFVIKLISTLSDSGLFHQA